MKEDELLLRLSQTLKKQVGPAVEGEYQKTQAFMAAVVLEKLGNQLGSKARHDEQNRRELEALATELTSLSSSVSLNTELNNELENFCAERSDGALSRLITGLYRNSAALGKGSMTTLMKPIRTHLRHAIDRRMEYAK